MTRMEEVKVVYNDKHDVSMRRQDRVVMTDEM